MVRPDESLDILRRFAPGTTLRDAVDLILQQGTGALILFGTGSSVDSLCSGGFTLTGSAFTAQRIAELSKMDGGMVVDEAASEIRRANVHFIPDPTLKTSETGTRHRTAERLSRQTGKPVLAVSEGRQTAVVYFDGERFELKHPAALLAEANQSLNSLERFRRRLTDAEDRLTRLEVDDIVTVRDVVALLQRSALVEGINTEISRLAVELGGEAHLIRIQAIDLVEGVGHLAELVYADYAKRRSSGAKVLGGLRELDPEELADAARVGSMLKLGPLDGAITPRGLRVLSRVPRLPENVRESLISHFGSFQKMLHAPLGDLDQVDGVGPTRARQLRTYFDRLLQQSNFWEIEG
jgi:diadenylate cyclase